jgi:signal transduction histidine kinase
LFFAISSLTRTTMRAERDAYARALGRVVAARVAEAQATRAPGAIAELLEAQIGGASGLVALGIYEPSGVSSVRAGDPNVIASLPDRVVPRTEAVRTIHLENGRALEVTLPGPQGSVVALVRTDDDTGRLAALNRLVGLYTAAVAFTLLVFAYIALGRLVVRPIDRLSRAAKQVAEGARELAVPHEGAREMLELGVSVAEMTRRLRKEEDALRSKISELEATTIELRAMQSSLVRSERLASVGRLAAGLAHEVGNPLAAIMGLQELLAEDLPADERRDFSRRMQSETERIHRILRDLLDFARPTHPQADGRSEDESPGDLAVSVEHVVSLIRPQRAMRDISLEVAIEPSHRMVSMSQEHLVQVLLNLVLNAADATGDGGQIWVRSSPVLGENGQVTQVALVVEDNGPGIALEVAQTLFEPFVTTKDVGKGTGLGLAVCRGLVEGCGGSISAEPREGGGARFEIRLPVAR